MKILKAVLLFLVAAGMTSCSTLKRAESGAKLEGFKYNYCSPAAANPQGQTRWKESQKTDLSKTGISAHDQLLCQILGISEPVSKLFVLHQEKQAENTAQQVSLRQILTNRILLAQTQLQAVAAELDCEGERSDMAAAYLDGINSNRNRKLTVGSVVIGALTTLATAVISKNSVQTSVAIGGGLLSAGLGALTINPKGNQIEFYHERNLLKSIWADTAQNTDYPEFVWEMLHEKQFSNSGNVSLAQSIKKRWLKFEFSGKIDKDQETLLFGTGGYYHADDLHTRASLINQLQSSVRSLNQDLTSLIAFIATLE